MSEDEDAEENKSVKRQNWLLEVKEERRMNLLDDVMFQHVPNRNVE